MNSQATGMGGMDDMNSKKHWEAVYGSKSADAVSWYAPHLQTSLRYIQRAAPDRHSRIIDIGGGQATLVDDLLAAGYENLAVLDLSETALAATRLRLGTAAAAVQWLAADVLESDFAPDSLDVWHDRAVFHFLTTDLQRRRYVQQVLKALRVGGHAIVATFGPDGPLQCSGLDVARYAPEQLHGTFGAPFQLMDSTTEIHTTPWGAPQQFTYCFCRMQER